MDKPNLDDAFNSLKILKPLWHKVKVISVIILSFIFITFGTSLPSHFLGVHDFGLEDVPHLAENHSPAPPQSHSSQSHSSQSHPSQSHSSQSHPSQSHPSQSHPHNRSSKIPEQINNSFMR